MIIVNAFSGNMLPDTPTKCIEFNALTLDQAKKCLAKAGIVTSAVGHIDTARLFSNLLERDVPANRVEVKIGDEPLLLGQYSGPRLPEGATELPEGATIRWYYVSDHYCHSM